MMLEMGSPTQRLKPHRHDQVPPGFQKKARFPENGRLMPDSSAQLQEILDKLNPEQQVAVRHGRTPLLIVAGAGTGKTATLVHRVAWLIAQGTDPQKILLLTFTRRSAEEMLRRVQNLLKKLEIASGRSIGTHVWGGTFHATATRLLRRYGKAIDLPPEFSVLDRSDSEDLLNVVRTELGLVKTDRRFPQKGTCMDIYSRCVNARQKLDEVLKNDFPWCKDWSAELARLFNAYVDRKEKAAILDYDDLLLYWNAMLADAQAGPTIRRLFAYVLVDEYQDTNVLQAEILKGLRPDGAGLTVVGDDAQSIYSFRAATVRNILEFPDQYPDTAVVKLEQNYRSTQPILDATNRVIEQAHHRFTKNLWSTREDAEKPTFVTCQDEESQTDWLIRRILDAREQGVALRRQAVLFRASHHSMLLEAELTRRQIPFHKYGGLKFVETAHIKDLLGFLRLADNPRDIVAGMRVLPLLEGIGPAKARQLMDMLGDSSERFSPWRQWKPPPGALHVWPQLLDLLEGLVQDDRDLPGQVHRVRKFYTPLLQEKYDHPGPRARDLEQMEQIAARYKTRRRMLLEMALDPPNSTQDLAGDPILDDDYLVLSTIHSAKGLEWDSVHVIHAADGNIPSDMATGSSEEIEEELRLFYVALTRAKNRLFVYCPLRYYHYRAGVSDRYGMAQRTRFLPDSVLAFFQRRTAGTILGDDGSADLETGLTSQSVRRQAKDLWS